MNKAELTDIVAKKARLTKKDALMAIEVIFDTILETTDNGEIVFIPSFGKFEKKKYKSRTGINLLTKEKIQIEERNHLVFVPSSNVKKTINK